MTRSLLLNKNTNISIYREKMEDENSWVFDSLVAFLNGPIWNAPLQSFIEEKSLIFEPNVLENEDYRGIFEEFKNMVDFMLGNFMEDIGITPKQFEDACSEGKKLRVSFDTNLFEQIWAANDYEMFKRMMTQRNVELQLQALELIEQKYGITPQSFIPNKIQSTTQEIPVIIENSKLEKAILDEVAKKFPDESTSDIIEIWEEQEILEEKEILEKALKEAKEKVDDQLTESMKTVENPSQCHSKTPEKVIKEVKPTKAAEKMAEPKNNTLEVNDRDLKKRQEYLRAQRDKLVALKKEERKKQVTDGTDKFKIRPKSAKAAAALLTGEQSTIEPQSLAERLKSEVVSQKQDVS
ncbi:unnamed protein product [Brassicogethes aeneus]|uniref:Cilia- and flagella-associated protein 36 n=1 Tax=Brassicogethes aeneus TaxID=1431903 RepID=A0A9P0FEQ1_BRAAE|nr:unnamed protein product [Brassicogethes aeneus]